MGLERPFLQGAARGPGLRGTAEPVQGGRERGDATPRGLRMSSNSSESLRQVADSDWFELGRRTAKAYACHHDWLFRRVETIEFVGRRSVKRSISVDFEIAEQ